MSQSESDPTAPSAGSIPWIDLTVPDASGVCQFYQQVAGWSVEKVSMGDYDDYCMVNAAGDTVAGICHARGENSDQPPQWLIYINVANLDDSIAACTEQGGEILSAPRQVSGGRCAVIRDPANAVAALYQADKTQSV